jgi:hypothetical protein
MVQRATSKREHAPRRAQLALQAEPRSSIFRRRSMHVPTERMVPADGSQTVSSRTSIGYFDIIGRYFPTSAPTS